MSTKLFAQDELSEAFKYFKKDFATITETFPFMTEEEYTEIVIRSYTEMCVEAHQTNNLKLLRNSVLQLLAIFTGFKRDIPSMVQQFSKRLLESEA